MKSFPLNILQDIAVDCASTLTDAIETEYTVAEATTLSHNAVPCEKPSVSGCLTGRGPTVIQGFLEVKQSDGIIVTKDLDEEEGEDFLEDAIYEFTNIVLNYVIGKIANYIENPIEYDVPIVHLDGGHTPEAELTPAFYINLKSSSGANIHVTIYSNITLNVE